MTSPPASITRSAPGRESSWRQAAQGAGRFAGAPVARVRRRLEHWWQARLPLTDTLTLTQRNVYILPTRPGFMLGITLVVLLVGSINYQLNLGYLLTFLLAGSAAVGMHVCHATLRGLRLILLPPGPQFAGASTTLSVVLDNARRSVRRPRSSSGGSPRRRWRTG